MIRTLKFGGVTELLWYATKFWYILYKISVLHITHNKTEKYTTIFVLVIVDTQQCVTNAMA